jgi:type IV secretion system protein VirD4
MSDDELELDKIGGYRVYDEETKKDLIVKDKTALFVIISDTDDSFNFIVALMYSQLFNLMCNRADNEFGGRLPVPTRFILDEFSNIGIIPRFEKLIATIRSREISACIILQAQSQLKSIYKDNAETITGNCDCMLFLGGKEKSTLEDISKMLGSETIDMYNTSVTKGTQESHGQNFLKLGKALMSVDEIAVMDGGRCIMQLRGERPFLSRKYDITRHKHYKQLSDYDQKNVFSIENHLSTKAKFKPEDEFDIIEIDFT